MDELTYGIDDTTGLTDAECKSLRDCLMNLGPVEFMEEVISRKKLDPRHVGIAFSLDPTLDLNEEHFLKLLGSAITRAFWKRKKLSELTFALTTELH